MRKKGGGVDEINWSAPQHWEATFNLLIAIIRAMSVKVYLITWHFIYLDTDNMKTTKK